MYVLPVYVYGVPTKVETVIITRSKNSGMPKRKRERSQAEVVLYLLVLDVIFATYMLQALLHVGVCAQTTRRKLSLSSAHKDRVF